MFKRFFRYLRALIMGKLDQLEDPQVIIDQAMREMKENQAKNREKAVQAITQKNQLQNMVDQEEKICRELESKATFAVQQGNREVARQLLREKLAHDSTLTQLRESLKQAEETSAAVKVAIKREEETFRVKTAEALALKAKMKQAQIQTEINRALDGFQATDATESFDRASEKIRSMQAEADARAEVAKTSVQSRLMELNDQQIDMEAESALKDLESKLGVGAAPTTVTTSGVVAGAQEDDIDRQLRELEQKLSS
jgi:phage shock protein A